MIYVNPPAKILSASIFAATWVALVAALPAFSQLSWDPGSTPLAPSGGAGTWDASTANWSNGSTDTAWSANTAIFGGTGGAVTISGTQNVTGLTINSSGYNLTAGAIDIGSGVALAVGGSFSGITTISSTIAGSGALTFAGPNTIAIVKLDGNNSYGGGTIISGSSRVWAASNNALGSGSITFSGSLSNELILGSGVTLAQNIVANVPARVSVNTGTATLSGVISGTSPTNSSLVKNGPGTLVVSGANTYAGPTSVSGVGGNGVLGLGANDVLSANTFYLNSGTFALNGFDESVEALAFTSGSIDFGSGDSNLAFGSTAGTTWSGATSLNILNFTPGVESLRFGTDSSGLTPAQLARIQFGSTGAQIDALGYVTPIPEPSTYAALAGLAALGLSFHHRMFRHCGGPNSLNQKQK